MGRKKSVAETLTQYFFKSKPKRLALTPPPINQSASLSDIDRYLFDNFRSVYENDADTSPRYTDPPTDSIRASKRFFVSAAPTGSLIEEARMSTASIASKLSDAMPLVTESMDPYCDFRQSMEEMVEAQHVDGCGSLDWDFLEQMLVYYLELNDKEVHDVIFRAFVDLTEELMVDNGEMRDDARRFGIQQRWGSSESVLLN